MQFHPRIIEASRSCFQSGHYREAILNSFISIIDYVKEKTSSEDEGKSLMAHVFDEKNPLIKIGFGYLSLHKLELKDAIASFETVLKADPKNEMAKTFLGIAKALLPKEMLKGEKLLHESLQSDDKGIKKLAGTALEFVDKFLKKEPSPAELKKAKRK